MSDHDHDSGAGVRERGALRAADLGYVTPLRCACGHRTALDAPICIACGASILGEALAAPPTEDTALPERLAAFEVQGLRAPAAGLAQFLREQAISEKRYEKSAKRGCLLSVIGLLIAIVAVVLAIFWTIWFGLLAFVSVVGVGLSFGRGAKAAGFDLPDQEMAFLIGLLEGVAEARPQATVALSTWLRRTDTELPKIDERPKMKVELLSAWPHHGGRRINRICWLSAEVSDGELAAPLRLSALRWFDTTRPLKTADKKAPVLQQVREVFALEAVGADALPAVEPAEQDDLTAEETAGGRVLLRTSWRRSDAATPQEGIAGSLSATLGRQVAARWLALRG